MLSGTDLDLDTWNLDSIRDNYVIISADDVESSSNVVIDSLGSGMVPSAGIPIGTPNHFEPVFDGTGIFRPGALDQLGSAIDELRERMPASPILDVIESSSDPSRLDVIRSIVADALDGRLALKLREPITRGSYVVLVDEPDAAIQPRSDASGAGPAEPLLTRDAGGTEAASSGITPSEGGEIPLEPIVATVGDVPALRGKRFERAPVDGMPVAGRNAGPSYVVGELARAVAFETIDGDPAPVVYAALDEGAERPDAAVAAADLEEFVAPLPSELATAADAGRREPSPLTPVLYDALTADDLALQLADLPAPAAAHAAGSATSKAVVAEAFAELDDDDFDADRERLDRDEEPHLWLAGMPILAALAAERLVASRRKSSQTEVRPPRPAGR